MIDMMDPKAREALAVRIARAAHEIAALRGILNDVAGKRYEGAGTTLLSTETPALNAICLYAEDVQMALHSIAGRLDRDLASKV